MDMTRLIKFTGVGVLGLCVNLGVTYLLTEFLRVWYLISFTIAALIGWSLMFLANSFFTFAGHSTERYFRRYITFVSGYVGVFAINFVLVFLLTSILHVYYVMSIVVATAVTFLLSFSFVRRYVYH